MRAAIRQISNSCTCNISGVVLAARFLAWGAGGGWQYGVEQALQG